MRTRVDSPGNSTSLSITSEGLPLLNALTIIVRSMHNCRVFGYYSGIQKLTALMKGTHNVCFSCYFLLCGDGFLVVLTFNHCKIHSHLGSFLGPRRELLSLTWCLSSKFLIHNFEYCPFVSRVVTAIKVRMFCPFLLYFCF